MIDKLLLYGIRFVAFREPDMDNELTSVAVEALPQEDQKSFFKNFKLLT